MLNEKVSIIMPACNAEKTIDRAINSIVCQNYENIELIIVNNGSTDKTAEIIKKYEKILKGKIKNIYTEIPNVSNARNIGIDNSTGKYLVFIDADDEFEKDYLEKMVLKLEETNSEMVTCAYKTVYNKKIWDLKEYEKIENTKNLKEYLEILKENYLFNQLWNKIYKTEIVKQNNIYFDKNYELGEDLIFNIDYIKKIKTASYINDALYVYTDGSNGLNLKYREDKFKIEYELTKKLEEFYKEKKYSLEYIYNRFARVYYNGILNIYNPNNKKTKKEKNACLREFINTKKYKDDLEFLKEKVTDRKFKIAIKYFFTKGVLPIKIFVILNNLRRK